MATVGHVAVGIAAARAYHHGRLPRWPVLAAWSALALLPDADVIGFPLGVQYSDPWGHRGASHSLLFAVATGAIVGLLAGWFKRPAARTALFTALAIGSHGPLDTLTDGGLGCALFWPFDLTRYFAPWRPIPVAPIGPAMLSPYGLAVVLVEIALFGPVLFYSLRTRTARPTSRTGVVVLGIWAVSVWLIASGDPVRESVVRFLVRDRTVFPAGFSEDAFRTIATGMADHEVRRLLGPPFGEGRFYAPKQPAAQSAREISAASLRECRSIRFENAVVLMAYEPDACRALGIQPGTSRDEVEQRLGAPSESCWQYSRSPGFAFRMRVVCFDHGKVDGVIRGWTLGEPE